MVDPPVAAGAAILFQTARRAPPRLLEHLRPALLLQGCPGPDAAAQTRGRCLRGRQRRNLRHGPTGRSHQVDAQRSHPVVRTASDDLFFKHHYHLFCYRTIRS